ncbi:hypothetical protein PPS11_44808 [Pseudomonas putida S11]|nr:hypothetical protein PPS11_44808 [Pseudomonas putida S11]
MPAARTADTVAQGHAVVAGQQGFQVGVFVEHGGGDGVAFVDFPVAALHRNDLDLRGVHGVLEAGGTLLGVGGGRHAFDDADLVAGLELLVGQVVTRPGARPCGCRGPRRVR